MNQQQKKDILKDLNRLLDSVNKTLNDTLEVRSSTKTQIGHADSQLGDEMIQHGTTAVARLKECAEAIKRAINEIQGIPTKSS